MSKQITLDYEKYNEVFSSAVKWDSLMSMLDPLLSEGYKVSIGRASVPNEVYEVGYIYQVEVSDSAGAIVASSLGYPLTEALQDAYQSTPEVVT